MIKDLQKPINIIMLLCASCLLIWPFSFKGISSQIIGILMLLPLLAKNINKQSLKESNYKILLIIIPLIFTLTYNILTNTYKHNSIGIFLFYILKIPFFFFFTFLILEYIKQKNINKTTFLFTIFACVLPFIFTLLLQIIFPQFNNLIVANFQDIRVIETINNNASGHPWRFLGWNGFLYASHSLALAFTALFLLTIRYILMINKKTICILFIIEYTCLLLALLAGRSALPIVFIYIFISILLANSFSNKFKLFLFYIISFSLIFQLLSLTDEGNKLRIWILEPITTSLHHKKLMSYSVNDLNNTYTNFSNKDTNFSNKDTNFSNKDILKIVFGYGFYSKDNKTYRNINLAASDSGIIRMIYASGYIGLSVFICFWVVSYIKAIIAGIKNNKHILLLIIYTIFTLYSFIFFYKSEWLYQNFFLFYFFILYHLLHKKVNM